jgi:hypothetical protein
MSFRQLAESFAYKTSNSRSTLSRVVDDPALQRYPLTCESARALSLFESLGHRHHLGCWITGGGSVTQEPPFWTITVPLPFVSVSVAAICRLTALGDPIGRLVVPVALRDCPAASGTEFSATLKAPRRTVVVAPECVTLNVEPFPVSVVHALNQLESGSSNATSTSGRVVTDGGVPVFGVTVNVIWALPSDDVALVKGNTHGLTN